MNPVFDAIADGLATNGYAVADQFLSQHEVDAILHAGGFQTNADFKKAGIGNKQSLQIQEAIRGDYIKWLDRNNSPEAIRVYLQRLEELIQYLNRSLFLSLKDFEVHMTVYPVGSFYKRHLDQFKKDDHRKLSVILYLNNQWEEQHGGQLRMYLPDQTKDVLPLAGRLVIFRSDEIEHEVLPATRERLSITGWVLDRLAELKHI
ncbi:MAG TPA: 2OG-Fe(II) oxygenase [Cyclobacteriaceae bacterium]|nr:2OG-Fe(II) oxygenase [Cyclobacteriaceae bacterium]HMV07697.1 2OG-Fe(II) oxygenase [Cyclobacteriaceae bacterium]HMV88498.1 2OG-Fe(II) oxygenase [Cyclobacteriaceae bacterium]HMW98832.1 2OG-Fe(II) oxygenase [Cyclobacteriaceae bacterium]HMX48535.1 2OG-Fe(II) oxygenase [Cyclobacteriaceae bacterium]